MAKIIGKPSPYLRQMSLHHLYRSTLIFLGTLSTILILIQAQSYYPNRIIGLVATYFPMTVLIILAYRFYKEDDKASDNYYRGRKGEGIILEELKRLPDEFRVLCDVKIHPPYNIDYVVLGPTGIFTVEVKSHSGNIEYENGRITINGEVPKEKDFLRQAKSEAQAVSDFLKQRMSHQNWVNPVLVFSSAAAKMRFGLKSVDGVLVVGKGFLLSLLQSGAGKIGESDLLEIEKAITLVLSE